MPSVLLASARLSLTRHHNIHTHTQSHNGTHTPFGIHGVHMECAYAFIHMFKSLLCPYTAVQTIMGRCSLVLKLITGISAKKHTPGRSQPSNTGPLFQLLHIAAPIRVEQVQNQN